MTNLETPSRAVVRFYNKREHYHWPLLYRLALRWGKEEAVQPALLARSLH